MKKIMSIFILALLALTPLAFGMPLGLKLSNTATTSAATEDSVFPVQFMSGESIRTSVMPDAVTTQTTKKVKPTSAAESSFRVTRTTRGSTFPTQVEAFVAQQDMNPVNVQTFFTAYRNVQPIVDFKDVGLPLQFGGKAGLQTMIVGKQYPGHYNSQHRNLNVKFWKGEVIIKGVVSGTVEGWYQPLTSTSGAFLGHFTDKYTGAKKLAHGVYGVGPNGNNQWYLWEPDHPQPATTVLHGRAYVPFR